MMLPMTAFALPRLAAEHLDQSVLLSSAQGWPHQRKDWALLLPFSEGTVATKDGQVVGTAIRSDFGPDLSTINMVIVSEDQRGKGLGRDMMQALAPDESRTIRLVATLSGRPLYQKLGFHDIASVAQHQGVVAKTPGFTGVESAGLDDMKSIANLESESFGGDRTALVNWLETNTRLSVVRSQEKVTGYAACRPFGRGHVIGPVVAETPHDAKALIAYHLHDLAGQFVRLDIMKDSALSPWLIDLGLLLVSQPPIMQRGEASIAPNRVALFSQALA
jgi:ribosomal protein S18 acetylase RimI-like enzyme